MTDKELFIKSIKFSVAFSLIAIAGLLIIFSFAAGEGILGMLGFSMAFVFYPLEIYLAIF